MILRCNFEELSALRAGARALLDPVPGEEASVVAPPEDKVHVEALLSGLDGDLSVQTLAELDSIVRGVGAIVEHFRTEMEVAVVVTHPAHEGAVSAYFDFAHAFTVLTRVREMADEMHALVELMNGRPVSEEDRQGFFFPD